MKLVTAVVKPHRVEEVKEALREIGVNGLTTTDVEGFGASAATPRSIAGADIKVDFVPKVRVEVVVDDDEVERHRGANRQRRRARARSATASSG